MKKIKLKSPAKINLTLEVIQKLSNGYHELRSVMAKLRNLYDEIEVTFDRKNVGIEIVCDHEHVPVGKENICYKIAEKFFERTGQKVGLRIDIKKRIPVAAGLAGGSSNGAVVLLALNKYFKQALKNKELIEIASEVGKDIPFFLQEEAVACVAGMGEKLKKINKRFKGHILVVKHNGQISTPWAYKELDKIKKLIKNSKEINFTSKFSRNISNLEKSISFLYNDFKIVAQKKYPVTELLQRELISSGALNASITGKGPTIYGIFKNKKMALEARENLKRNYPDFFIELG